MACAIVAGYALDCKDAVGGIKNIYVAPIANVSTVSENASGYVTAITMSGSNKFFKYALEPRGANSTTQNIQSDPTVGTVSYEQTMAVSFLKMKYETQNKLQTIIANRTAILVEMKTGQYFYFGKENGMEVSGGTAASGAAMSEFNGYNVTFAGMEKALANEVEPTIVSALVSTVV
jgi:hypothetical protein